MARKSYDKRNGIAAFIKTLLSGTPEEIEEAQRKEASRQVGEMLKWMKDQEDNDPIGMLWSYEEDIFPMIKRAVQYRGLIYDRNKKIAKIQFDLIKAEHTGDLEEDARLRDHWRDLEAEQAGLCWRIRKIHAQVRGLILADLSEDEKNPFEEYEYDPERS